MYDVYCAAAVGQATMDTNTHLFVVPSQLYILHCYSASSSCAHHYIGHPIGHTSLATNLDILNRWEMFWINPHLDNSVVGP